MSEQTATTARYLTPEDLGNLLQVSVGTIANWRTSKTKGPDFIRIGGLVRYSPEAVNAWLEAQPTK
jgi:predicted DNA-binding transcriptional regulator AlpA